MDLYGQKSTSIPQKVVVVIIQLLLIRLSYWILFQEGGHLVLGKIGLEATQGNADSKMIIFAFICIVFVRMTFMMFYLLKRRMPWEEVFSVGMAFALYYIGFALLVYNRRAPLDSLDYIGIAIFLIGSYLNTASELQRNLWKKRPEHKGKLYTEGLFRYSMHINYFGDVLWVTAFAIITRSYYAIPIPCLLLCLFVFWNIPTLDRYLAEKYKEPFEEYSKRTKKLIPFIY